MTEENKAMDEATQKTWGERVGKFATDVKKTADEIAKALEELIGEPGADALEALADPAACTDDDLIGALKGLKIPTAILRKNVQTLRGPKPVVEAPPVAPATAIFDILPQVDNDESFLAALKVGGTLATGLNPTDVTAAAKAALADAAGMYDLPGIIAERMEVYAESLDQAVGPEFYSLLKLVKKRQYADILSAFELDASYITNARRDKLLGRLRTDLWSEMQSFHESLNGWVQTCQTGMMAPGMLVSQIVQAVSPGANAGGLPAAMMAIPDTSPLLDAAEGFINKVNKIFAGTGVPVARAMAYEALTIKKILENPTLPAQIGAANRDDMLRLLGVSLSADYVRLEHSVVRYALSIIALPDRTPGQDLQNFLAALWQLGVSIPWDKLQHTENPTGKGRR